MSRVVIPEMDNILHKPFKVLDKGEIRLIEYMGSDSTIVNAARVSYGKGTQNTRSDKGLINYLLYNMHTSPFEMCEIVLYIKLPIFVAAQWIRHRTANINSYSARYSVLPDEFYVPEAEAIKTQSGTNKQCSGDALDPAIAAKISKSIEKQCNDAYKLYEEMMEQGLSRELARMILPQNIYTTWYWKIDLHNLMHFIKLRLHPHAQKEIRDYAEVLLHKILKIWVPHTYQAFCDYRLGSMNMSSKAQQVIQDHVKGEPKTREEYGVGKGEWANILEVLRIS